MTTSHPSTDERQTPDREALSALFDSQLQGDAARFALKRLGHDAQWRQACGRWQLYGDVMRGQAGAIAASGFAERVAVAIAREPQSQAAHATTKAGGQRRGWIGGAALAASVAVAALFVTRPFSDEPASPATAPARVASAPAPTRTLPAAPTARQAPALPTRSPNPSLDLAAAAVAAVEVPRRVADRRTSRGQNQRAALRTRQNPAPTVAAAVAAAPVLQAPVTAHKPFQPQHVETTARPWPRAVLPQYSGGNAMTASFGTELQPSPSFYPFEPPAAPESEATIPADESLRR